MDVFDHIRAGVAGDRSQFYKDLAVQFYGANRPGAKVSQGILDQFWLWSMQAGALNAYESVKAFSETDFTEDLKKFDFPTLVLHGEDDQIVPVKDSAKEVREGDSVVRRRSTIRAHHMGSPQHIRTGSMLICWPFCRILYRSAWKSTPRVVRPMRSPRRGPLHSVGGFDTTEATDELMAKTAIGHPRMFRL